MLSISKVFFLTSTSTLLTFILQSIAMKIVAVVLGPSGVGQLGLIRQVYVSGITLTTLGGQTALVQGASSKQGEQRDKFLKATFYVFLTISILVSLAVILFAPIVSAIALKQNTQQAIDTIRVLAIALIFGGLNGYFFGYLNIHNYLKEIAISQVVSSFILCLISFQISNFANSMQSYAVLSFLILIPLVSSLFFLLHIMWKKNLLQKLYTRQLCIVPQEMTSFLLFSLTVALTSIVTSLTLLAIKGMILEKNGIIFLGNFEAAWNLSTVYITLMTTSFSTYLLPKMSELKLKEDKRVLLKNVFLFTTILGGLLIPLIIGVKNLLILILFSSEFSKSIEQLNWMLIGDYFKLLSWVLGTCMLAFGDKKSILITELAFSLTLLTSVYLLTPFNELELLGLGFSLIYILHFIVMNIYIVSKLGMYFDRKVLVIWLFGLALVIFSSILMWNEQQFNIYKLAIIFTFSIIFLLTCAKLLNIKSVNQLRVNL